MDLWYAIKKMFHDWFGKADYQKKLSEFDASAKKAFNEHVAKSTPYSEFVLVDEIISALQQDVIPEPVIERMYMTFTSEGWDYIRGYLRLLQKTIEKRLVYSDITDREWLVRRVEHGIYDKLIVYENDIRAKYAEILNRRANQKAQTK